MSWGDFRGVHLKKNQKHVWKMFGVGSGAGEMVQKCLKTCPEGIFLLFWHFKTVFLILNALRGRGGEAATTSGSLYGDENGLKC